MPHNKILSLPSLAGRPTSARGGPTSSDLSYSNYSGLHEPVALQPPPPTGLPAMSLGLNQGSFTYEELAAATDGFSQANLLGEGGLGYMLGKR